MIFKEKCFSWYNLLTDQISLSDCLYFSSYWAICVLHLFVKQAIVKLYVYKTVKCEVINVGFLSKDLLLDNSAIIVKWKCLKFLYSSKGMCRIHSQLKKLIRLKYLILETSYTFSLHSVGILLFSTPNTQSPMFSGIKNRDFSFFCVCFYDFFKKILKYS